MTVVENALITQATFQPKLEKTKKSHPEKILMFFPKKSHPKQILYTFVKKCFIHMDQPRADMVKRKLYSDSHYFLHSRKFFNIPTLQKILISFTTILTFLFFFFFRKISMLFTRRFSFFVIFFLRKILVPFTCFFQKISFVFLIIAIFHFYIYKAKKIFYQSFYML